MKKQKLVHVHDRYEDACICDIMWKLYIEGKLKFKNVPSADYIKLTEYFDKY